MTLVRDTLRAAATFSDPHSTDRYEKLTIAMNLMPLIDDPAADVAAFTTAHLRRTEEDIFERIERLGDGRSE